MWALKAAAPEPVHMGPKGQNNKGCVSFLLLPAETLRRSNLALRQRCEEMEGWQQRTREDREFLSCRFQEARALVERLAEENHSLRGFVNGPVSSSSPSSGQAEDLQGPPLPQGPVDGAQVSYANVSPVEKVSSKRLIGCSLQTLEQRDRKRLEEADQCTQTTPPRSLVRTTHEGLPGQVSLCVLPVGCRTAHLSGVRL